MKVNEAKKICFLCRHGKKWLVMHSREDFTTDGTDATHKSRLIRNHFQSVKSVKSAVQFLWLRLAALGLLRLFAANPQPPNRVQSCHFYDPCTATVAFFAHFQLFRGKSIEVLLHEPFTRHMEFSSSSPIKPNQA